MKRYIHILTAVLLCLIMLCPITASAKTYQLEDTDISSILIDETYWYVFTRDNIENNPELEELEIPYDEMYDILYSNDVYMDAIMFYEDGEYIELFVRKKPTDAGVANLSNYDDDEVLEFSEELAKQQKAEDYSIYENKYKFARLEYEQAGFYMCQYVTIVNKNVYSFSFQATMEYIDSEYEEMKNIVDSVKFDVDTSLKEKKNDSIWGSVITKALIGAAVGGAGGAVISIIAKKKKSKTNMNTNPFMNNNNIE